MLIIKNGRIVTMTDQLIDGGDILINENKIYEIHDNTDYTPSTSDIVIDADGNYIFPGFIDAHTHCGLNGEIGDIYNKNTQIFPKTRAYKFIDVSSDDFSDRIKRGITSVAVAPFDYHVVGGKSCLVKTAPTEDNKLNIVSESCYDMFSLNIDNNELASTLLGNCLSDASSYLTHFSPVFYPYPQPLLQEYKHVLVDNKPAFFSVADVVQLKRAQQLIDLYSINGVIVLSGSFDGDDIDSFSTNYSYVFSPVESNPTFRKQFAAKFSDKASPVAISASGSSGCYDMLAMNAGLMVHEGLDITKTLNSITTIPAQFCDASDRVGRIKEGMDADIVICDSNPLELLSNIIYTIVDGRIVYRI